MKCTVPVYENKYEGDIKLTDLRLRILCNAWYGLNLLSGSRLTPTAIAQSRTAIRALQKKGALYGEKVTDKGAHMLSLIRCRDRHRWQVPENEDLGV